MKYDNNELLKYYEKAKNDRVLEHCVTLADEDNWPYTREQKRRFRISLAHTYFVTSYELNDELAHALAKLYIDCFYCGYTTLFKVMK